MVTSSRESVEPEVGGDAGEFGQRLEASAPMLYRHLALYLQVLREILPGRVEQASFHLATQVDPLRYSGLPFDHRLHLHERIQSLIRRCLALLTVEQISSLAAHIHRQQQRQILQDRGRGRASPPPRPEAPAAGGAEHRGDPAPAYRRPRPPTGSVRLGFTLPAVPRWHGVVPGGEPAEPAGGGPPVPADPLPVNPFEEDDAEHLPEASPSLWQDPQLPRHPELLLQWLQGMDEALTRRLRNLSHALNVELLRAGLSSTLLPVNLLDAVLAGQLETLTAPPNLLRLQIPIALAQGSDPLEAMAILLRCADLEMEEPRLRTCRRRLEQHRLQVRTMAKEYRHLERRLQKRQAESLWLQDIRRSRPESG